MRVTSDAQGVFALTVPAEGDLTVTATAPGYGGRVAGVTTSGGDVHGWLLVLTPEAELHKRYASIEAAPDLTTGKIFATTRAMTGGRGSENVTVTVDPKAASGPLYFAPDGKPDPARTATSTWANGVFAGAAPGVAELHVRAGGGDVHPVLRRVAARTRTAR